MSDASWQILEDIGAYATGEPMGEEVSCIDRFVREDAQGLRLAHGSEAPVVGC